MIGFYYVLSIIGAVLSGILIFSSQPATIPYLIGSLIACVLNILFYGELKTMKEDIERTKTDCSNIHNKLQSIKDDTNKKELDALYKKFDNLLLEKTLENDSANKAE